MTFHATASPHLHLRQRNRIPIRPLDGQPRAIHQAVHPHQERVVARRRVFGHGDAIAVSDDRARCPERGEGLPPARLVVLLPPEEVVLIRVVDLAQELREDLVARVEGRVRLPVERQFQDAALYLPDLPSRYRNWCCSSVTSPKDKLTGYRLKPYPGRVICYASIPRNHHPG